MFLWRLGSSRLRTIGHTGRCRADFTKPIAPKFSAPYCQLLPLKHFCHCLQQKMATIPSALRSGTDIATDVWGAGARLRISGYAGTRAEESPSAAAPTGLPCISARRPGCEGELQNQQRRMQHRPIQLPRIRRTVEQFAGPAKHRLQLLVSVLIARHAAVTNPPDSG